MLEHLAVIAAVTPLQFGLGALNTHTHWLTAGEVRFWGVVLFLMAELVYLGTFP